MTKRQASATKKALEAQKKLMNDASLSIARANADAIRRTRLIEAECEARWAAEDAAKGQ